jgi:histidine triad (HIT) family protein
VNFWIQGNKAGFRSGIIFTVNKGGFMDCLFCRIVGAELPSNKYYEDDNLLAIENINPEAPFHALIMPKKHLELPKIEKEDLKILGKLLSIAPIIAEKENLTGGYRLIINIGEDSNRDFDHLHIHLVGGKNLGAILPDSLK